MGVCFSKTKSNPRRGKFLYRKNCRLCHKSGAKATDLSPDSKTMAQWKRAFEPKKYATYKCVADWNKRTETEIADIFSYLYKYAADSPTPAKCQ